MATISRGPKDQYVKALKHVLDEYEQQHPGAAASLYRQNTASVRIRVVDDHFAAISKGERHDQVWAFLADRLDDDTLQEISVLLAFPRSELTESWADQDHEDPIRSDF